MLCVGIALAQPPAFQTATVKEVVATAPRFHFAWEFSTTKDSLKLPYVTLWEAIALAYGVQNYQVKDAPLETHYQISGTAAKPATRTELFTMLRPLLAERFKLAVHRESSAVNAFVLKQGGEAPKLQKAAGGDFSAVPQGSTIEFKNCDMFLLAAMLSDNFEEVVLDETGLKGSYDFKIDLGPFLGKPLVSAEGLSGEGALFYQAVQAQLGLKIEKKKTNVEVWLVDHFEKLRQ